MLDGLTEAETRLWKPLLLSTGRLQARLDEALKERYSLDHLDWRILVRLASGPDHGVRMSQVAYYAHIDSSLLTYRIKRLERLSLAKRESHPGDGRGVNAVITKGGRELVREAAPLYAKLVRELFFDNLEDPEVEVLEKVFARLWANLARGA